jgi:plastocyanin
MKYNIPIIIALIAGSAITLGATQLMRASGASADTCYNSSAQPQSRIIMIMDNHVEPSITNARLCDTVTITNMDNVAREIAFGPHENHVAYDGVSEKVLNLGQTLTITLNKAGDVHFHDHLHDEVDGHIIVTR